MNNQEILTEQMENQNKENDQILLVKNYIYSLLADHQIEIGDRLPSEKALSEQLDVSKSVVRDALQSLKTIGLLSSVRGSGYRLTPDFDYSLADIMHAMFVYSSATRRHIREVREALEMKELELLTGMEIPEETMEALLRVTGVMQDYKDKEKYTIEEAKILVETDMEFHHLLACACNNLFIRSFNIALNEYHDTNTKVTAESVRARVSNELLDTHIRMVEALRTGDVKLGEDAIREHYAIGDRVIQEKKEQEEDPILQSAIHQLQKKGYTRQQIMEKLMELA